jgi:hypothetical protein
MNSGLLVKTAVTLLFFSSAVGVCVAGPVVSLSPTSVNFGTHLVGTATQSKSVKLTNTGDATLNIISIKTTPPGGIFQQFSDCGNTLAAGASCTIRVQFAPLDPGQVQGTLAIQDSAPGSPHQATLKGVAKSAPVILTPNSLDFGALAVGTHSSVQTVTLTNHGAVSLTVNGVSTDSGDFVATNGCPRQLAAGGSCNISMTFNPSAAGTGVALLSVSDSDGSSPQLARLSGLGTSGSAALSPPTLTFGNQQVGSKSAPKTITLTNNGTTDMGIASIIASGDYSQTSTCGTALASGASCTIQVVFSPSGVGARQGFITVSDTAANALQTAPATGSGFVKASTVTVKPKVASVTFTQTQQFQAFINGSPSSDVIWSVDGIVGGNGSVGTITPAGLYTPPQAAGPHSVKATSNADPQQIFNVRVTVVNLAGVFTYHNDNARTGQNLTETVLTTGNVNKNQFGKLFSYPVDGVVRTTPLYVANVNIPGQGFHNVVYVASEHDTVYAFDADGRSSTPLWQVSFIDPANGIVPVPSDDVNRGCPGVGTEFGVTGTPVIDPATNRMFLLARTKDQSGPTPVYHQKLHVLDIASGTEVPGSPVEVQASVLGFGEGSHNGTLAFDPIKEHSRVAMLLLNGVVYEAWASICDNHPYHGWIIGWDASTLQQVAVFNLSPNGQAAGIWHSGAGMAADSDGNIYFETTNGLFDVDSNGSEYGQSVVKMSTTGGLAVADYFTPYNATALTHIDSDLSAFGVMLLPDQPQPPTHVLIGGNKKEGIYVIDRDNMGKFKPTDNSRVLQSLPIPAPCPEGAIFGVPAFWQNRIYLWPCGDVVRDYRFYNGLLYPTPVALGQLVSQYPAPLPSISANGNTNGILWALYNHNWVFGGPAILFAFDAANVNRLLYSSSGARDQAGTAAKGPTATVANGKVYLSTATELDVYGLLP